MRFHRPTYGRKVRTSEFILPFLVPRTAPSLGEVLRKYLRTSQVREEHKQRPGGSRGWGWV